MSCSVCGNPLIFDRTVFRCSCGAFVHAYCWDAHVLQAHKPSFEIGTVDLDGEFRSMEPEVIEEIEAEQIAAEQIAAEQIAAPIEE